MSFASFDLDALLGDEPPAPADYVIDGYLERGTHMLLCGRGGSGKTMLLNQLAIAGIAPRPDEFPFDLELPVRVKRVVWFDAEMGTLGTQRRYWRTGLRPYICPGRFEYVDASGLDLTERKHRDFIRSKLEGGDTLAVIDSLRRVSRYTQENSSDEMSAVVTGITNIAHDTGSGIVTIHHQGGDPNKWFRGSTAILDACDVLIGWLPHSYDSDDDKLRRLAARGTWSKMRHEAEPEDRWFRQTESGLFVPADAPEQIVTSKWDDAIRKLLPFTGTKTALAEACGTNSRNNAWADAYKRVAHTAEPNLHVSAEAVPGSATPDL